MNDLVSINLVFAKSGQELSVRLPRELALKAHTMPVMTVMAMAEQLQRNGYSGVMACETA